MLQKPEMRAICLSSFLCGFFQLEESYCLDSGTGCDEKKETMVFHQLDRRGKEA